MYMSDGKEEVSGPTVRYMASAAIQFTPDCI